MRWPRAGETTGASSSSQIALPRSPVARQLPVHEVAKPSPAQLPVNAKRSPPVIVKIASAAASPSYQLQGGFDASQYTRERVGAGDRPRAVEQVDRHVEQQRVREGEEELGRVVAVRDEELAGEVGEPAELRDRVAERDEPGE